MDPNIVHRQFLPGYSDPATWSSILYNYGGQGPANQLHDLRAEQPRALPHDSHSQRQQITGHDIAEFFARNTAPPPVTILNECHLQPQPQHPVSTAPHDVLDLGLSTVITPKKTDKEPAFIQDSAERSRFDKRRLKALKSTLTGWYKRSGCVTVALTYHDGQVHVSGPDHMMSLSRNEEFKSIFLNTLTSYDQLSRLADIVSNCNEEDNVTEQISAGDVQPPEIPDDGMVDHSSEPSDYSFVPATTDEMGRKSSDEPLAFDQDCKICSEKFTSKHFLKKHMVEVHNQAAPVLICTFCKKRFMTRWKLERHTIIHTGAKPYNCIYCPKRFAEKNKLVVHVKNHKEDFVDPQAIERLISSLLPKRKAAHDCTVCGKSFLSSWKLNRHVRIHSGEKPFKCSKCPKSFIEKSKLDQHELLPHDGSKVKGGAQEKRHECDKCGKKFISQWKLKRHELFHSGERPWQCDQCGKGFVENNKLILHKKFLHTDKDSSEIFQKSVNRSKKYECSDCNKKFATQWKLKRHSQTHSLERPYRCELCKRGFLTKNKLDLHNFTFHSEEGQESRAAESEQKGAEDEMVSSILTENKSLPNDQEMQKADLEPLKLPNLTTEKDSSKDFGSVDGHYINSDSIRAGVDNVALLTTDPSAIKASVQFDMGEDVASKLVDESKTCGECGRVFKTPSRLKRHMAVHTGVRPFKCKFCDKGFTERNKLINHLKGHGIENPEMMVEKVAKNEDDATSQQQSGGKHVCTECNRSFVSPWKLKRHQTIHTGKKPFFCKICEKAFAEKNKLENHFKSNHPTDVNLLQEELSQVQVTMVEPESAFSIVARTIDDEMPLKEKDEEDEKITLNLEPVVTKDDDAESTQQCYICCALFDSIEQLNTHIQVNHGDSNEPIVIVEQKAEPDLKKSLKYSCQICGKSFITPSKLKRHSFSHGEEKPFKCKKCGKRFSENNKLFNHLLTHDKPRLTKGLPKLKLKVKGSEDAEVETVSIVEESSPLLAIKSSSQIIAKKQQPDGISPETSESNQQIITSSQQGPETGAKPTYPDQPAVSSQSSLNSLQPPVHADKSTGVKKVSLTATAVEPQDHIYVATEAFPTSSSSHLSTVTSKVEGLYRSSTSHSEQSPDLPVVVTKRDIIKSNSEKLKMLVENAIGPMVVNDNTENDNAIKKVSGTFSEVLAGDAQSSGAAGTPIGSSAVAKSQALNFKNVPSHVALTQGTKSANNPYPCDICLEPFATVIDLRQHKIVSHVNFGIPQQAVTAELKYKCQECSKGFKTPSKLKRHQLSHTGETPFHCEFCPKQFKRKDSLRKHTEEHNRGK